MLQIVIGFLALGCLCLGSGWAGSDELDTYIRHEMEVRKIPGLAFVVVARLRPDLPRFMP